MAVSVILLKIMKIIADLQLQFSTLEVSKKFSSKKSDKTESHLFLTTCTCTLLVECLVLKRYVNMIH